jgi:xylose isomerase
VPAIEEKMTETGMKLLWGTANAFSHPRYAAGAATNPDPAVSADAAAQVSTPSRRPTTSVARTT